MVSCVILFIADRVAPAFRFCLDNSTLAHACPIRYSFFYLSHIIVTPTLIARILHKNLDLWRNFDYNYGIYLM